MIKSEYNETINVDDSIIKYKDIIKKGGVKNGKYNSCIRSTSGR